MSLLWEVGRIALQNALTTKIALMCMCRLVCERLSVFASDEERLQKTIASNVDCTKRLSQHVSMERRT